jgi:hypothetical protein
MCRGRCAHRQPRGPASLCTVLIPAKKVSDEGACPHIIFVLQSKREGSGDG